MRSGTTTERSLFPEDPAGPSGPEGIATALTGAGAPLPGPEGQAAPAANHSVSVFARDPAQAALPGSPGALERAFAPIPALRQRLALALGADGAASSDFDLNPESRPPELSLRPAGVLIGITAAERVLLTKRSSQLRHHPGQIAFPGGKVDPGDDGPVAAALREAREEVGLPEGAAEVLGVLPPHRTVTGFAVTPVVALLQDFRPRAEAGEVDEVFEVPLAHLLDPESYLIRARRMAGIYRRYYTVPWGPYYIWGATARMLRVLAARMG